MNRIVEGGPSFLGPNSDPGREVKDILASLPPKCDEALARGNVQAIMKVATATAVVFNPENPYEILLGRSEKHGGRFVTPGGKQESSDALALDCIVRELEEEVGVSVNPEQFRQIGTATDLVRDIRLVEKPEKVQELLRVARTTELVRMSDNQTLPIICAFGVPDELFAVPLNRSLGSDSEELKGVTWVDVRTLSSSEIGAGHDVVLLAYREMLDSGSAKLRELDNFSNASSDLAIRYG